ncbi:MAG: DNA repair protein RecO [Oscillospiraceae bacterium]|nr:DNA repair protein RecO [Oscillospiraceae bacterium]MDY2509293.1 DNA repair protein RecO [Ruminococcus callidus]
MLITKRCLILQERQAGDAGRFLDILTKTQGVMEVFVRGTKKANSKNLSATQPFSYAKLCLSEKNGKYYVESAEPIYLFYTLRESLTQLALAAYFFDLIRYAVPQGQQQNFILRLTLNTLYYLTTGKRSEAFLKSLFELRFLSELGMMPDVLVCPVCMEYLPQSLFYSARTGHFYCADCYHPTEEDYAVKMPLGGLKAVRHIVLTAPDRLFQFRLNDTTQQAVNQFSELFVRYQLDYQPQTLQFYKRLQFSGTIGK